MSQPRKQDHIAGFINQGKKWNPETQKYEPAAYLNIYIYQVDANNEPILQNTVKDKKGKEYQNYKIQRSYRVPLSTLSKVVGENAKRCQVFYTEKHF